MSEKAVELLGLIPTFSNEGDIESFVSDQDDGAREMLSGAKEAVDGYVNTLLDDLEEYKEKLVTFRGDMKAKSLAKLKDEYS